MTIQTELGYLETPYAENPYSSAAVSAADGIQFSAVISGNASRGAQFTAAATPKAPLGAQVKCLSTSEYVAGAQVLAEILDKPQAMGAEVQAEIAAALRYIGQEFNAIIQEQAAAGEQALTVVNRVSANGNQFSSYSMAEDFNGMQVSAQILSGIKASGSQLSAIIAETSASGTQEKSVINLSRAMGSQLGAVLSKRTAEAEQFLFNHVTHVRVAGYLSGNYLEDAYLVNIKSQWGLLRSQARAVIFHQTSVGCQFSATTQSKSASGNQMRAILYDEKAAATQFKANLRGDGVAAMQFQATLPGTKAKGFQFNSVLNKTQAYGQQFTGVNAQPMATQFRSVLYNTKNLRVLWEFPSRGTSPGSWTANTTMPGSFGAENLNSDIVEQSWRSNTAVRVGIKLVCDTGLVQGVFVDTVGILNHNFSTSAQVVLEGSNDPTFSAVGFTYTFPRIEKQNLFYIAPELPLLGYRYWRVSVDDASNPAQYIEVGTIVFGQATIWSGECFSNPVRWTKTQYLDQVFTEGFTNVANDRGIKKAINLDFESINFNGGNYSNYQEMLETVRTSLKALWIPTPEYPSRYAVFGKLKEIPAESHQDNGEQKDYVTFSVEVDEAK